MPHPATVNARHLVPVTAHPDDLFTLTPAALLTQKVNIVPAPAGEFGVSDLYSKQFLPTLQARKKWQSIHPNVKPGNVALLKNSQVPRNEWPLD